MGKELKEGQDSQQPSSQRRHIQKSPSSSVQARRKKILEKKRPSSKSEEDEVDQYYKKKCCEVCHQIDLETEMLLCDRCDDSYHLKCLNPPLEAIPEQEEWICEVCYKQMMILQQQKNLKNSKPAEEVCFVCLQPLKRKETISGKDQYNNIIQIQCESLVDMTCMYCKHSFHNVCFSERKNSLNCWTCQKEIRKKGPKSHDDFMRYIDKSIEQVTNSDHSAIVPALKFQNHSRHRYFRLKVPSYMNSWQFIVQYEASLYYAFTTKGLTFIDDQIYYKDPNEDLMELNSPHKDFHDKILSLHEKDEQTYQLFKINSKKGFVGPFQVKEDRIKGFYLVATDYIEPNTIVSEYCGEVMRSRDALKYEQNDSIFMLIRGTRSMQSLDIVPQKYGNISRFFSGINNSIKKSMWSKIQNIKSLRFSYKGRVHLLLHTIKPVQAGETLFFDYNGSAFHQYPTDHFVL